MKKIAFLLALGMAMVMTTTNAQILVNTDGGVKIGTPQVSSLPSPIDPSWQLSSKGLEVSVGDILFHTSKGNLQIDDFSTTTMSSGGGGITIGKNVNATAITGFNLCVGTSSDYAFRIYTDEIISTSSQKVLSDRRYKENIEDLGNVSGKVLQLRPVTFDFKTPENYTGDTTMLKGKVGFIAQEVQELFPNLVGYLPDADQYILDYTSLIPYLTQTIQLQAQQLAAQEERIADLEETIGVLLENLPTAQTRAPQAPSVGNERGNESIPQARLHQNTPNPFSGTTEIRYELPENVHSARIEVHAATGQLVKSQELPAEPGTGSVSFGSSDFATGIHTYSLIVDNQLVATKRMVVSE